MTATVLIIAANIGAKALYLLVVWLLSAIVASWLSNRAGYGEKAGLATGLILSAAAIVIWLVIYVALARDGSRRQVEGLIPRRQKADDTLPPALAPGGGDAGSA